MIVTKQIRFFGCVGPVSRHLHSKIPQVLYSDNHLLVINKTPGWHVVPNNYKGDDGSRKCLLTFLKAQKYGGGSKKDFLLPCHRIDQPCSGVVIMAKTSKAASRITTVWKQQQVIKTYLCLLSSSISSHECLDILQRNSLSPSSNNDNNDGMFRLQGWMDAKKQPPKRKNRSRDNLSQSVGWSVIIHSQRPHQQGKNQSKLVCCDWKAIGNNLILVRTHQGSRHLVRALLAQVGGQAILGDLRYGRTRQALPDRSVALHARSIDLPTSLVLGADGLSQPRRFVAPIPLTWTRCGGWTEEQIALLGV